MIRRWSCLNSLNSRFSDDFFLVSKQTKINIFKNSVNFKRYKFKYTKFKRKAITRVFHISTLLIYTNVFKNWSKDYLYSKHRFKNEFLFNMFHKNFYFYNFNFIKNRNENIFNNLNFMFSYLIKSKANSFNLNFKNSFVIPFLKNNSFSYAWFYKKPETNSNIIPVYSNYEGHLFSFNQNELNFPMHDLNSIFNFINDLNMENLKEIYKIISIFILKNVYFSKFN